MSTLGETAKQKSNAFVQGSREIVHRFVHKTALFVSMVVRLILALARSKYQYSNSCFQRSVSLTFKISSFFAKLSSLLYVDILFVS
jgi:hypothetical protein